MPRRTALNGADLDGRAINVDNAREQERKPGFGGGGSRGGYGGGGGGYGGGGGGMAAAADMAAAAPAAGYGERRFALLVAHLGRTDSKGPGDRPLFLRVAARLAGRLGRAARPQGRQRAGPPSSRASRPDRRWGRAGGVPADPGRRRRAGWGSRSRRRGICDGAAGRPGRQHDQGTEARRRRAAGAPGRRDRRARPRWPLPWRPLRPARPRTAIAPHITGAALRLGGQGVQRSFGRSR